MKLFALMDFSKAVLVVTMFSLAGGVANCPLRGVFFYVEKHLGLVLLSVIRSSGVSVLEGL